MKEIGEFQDQQLRRFRGRVRLWEGSGDVKIVIDDEIDDGDIDE